MTKFSTSAAVVEHHVVNRAGELLLTTPLRDIAKKRAAEYAARHDGVEVHEITVTTTRRRVFRADKPGLRGAALARAFA